MIICTCDLCGKTINGGLNVRESARYVRDGEPITDRWGPPIAGDFCDLLCLTGWAMAQAHKYGFEKRIPEAKP